MQLKFESRGHQVILGVRIEEDNLHVSVPNGDEHVIQASPIGDILRIKEGNRAIEFAIATIDGAIHISFQGQVYVFELSGRVQSNKTASRGSGVLIAPMVGLVTNVLVKEGDNVSAYQPLVVIEAMKVLVTLEAPFEGVVRKIHVKTGDRVMHGETCIEVHRASDR